LCYAGIGKIIEVWSLSSASTRSPSPYLDEVSGNYIVPNQSNIFISDEAQQGTRKRKSSNFILPIDPPEEEENVDLESQEKYDTHVEKRLKVNNTSTNNFICLLCDELLSDER
jgi:hypothetical protein